MKYSTKKPIRQEKLLSKHLAAEIRIYSLYETEERITIHTPFEGRNYDGDGRVDWLIEMTEELCGMHSAVCSYEREAMKEIAREALDAL